MYTTLEIISRKFLGVSLIWTFFHMLEPFVVKQPLSKNIKIKAKKYENNLKSCTEAAVT
jgi:hypothetical protein